MPRKTPEEMAVATRIKAARTLTRLQKSIEADYLLNDLIADIREDHELSLHSGEVKQLGAGTLGKVIEDIADIEAVIHGVKPEDRAKAVLPE